MKTVGVDVSSQPKGTASCLVHWSNGSARIDAVEEGLEDGRLEKVVNGPVDKVGIDVPLGWPDIFVDAVTRHQRGEPFGGSPTRDLRHRVTDIWVRQQTGQIPLSVTTDWISYPAMRMARILGRLSAPVVDRSGSDHLVEVYPAAALRVWRLRHNGYKGDEGRAVLEAIIGELRRRCPWLAADEPIWGQLARSDHAFDALICALIARAHQTGLCHPIPDGQEETARREGWIAVPMEGTLEGLAS